MGKLKGICRLCGQEKKFIRAHVISKTLFKSIFRNHEKVHLVKQGDLESKNPVQDAFYDNHILCGDCDRSFSPAEEYITNLLGYDLNRLGIALKNTKQLPGMHTDIYKGVDQKLVRLFFIIMLWRCSISKNPSFNLISLPEYEDWMKAQIVAQLAKDYDILPVIICSLKDVDDIRKDTAVAPSVLFMNGKKIVTLLVKGHVIIYGLETPYPSIFSNRVKPGQELQVVRLDKLTAIPLLNQITGIPLNIPQSLLDEVKADLEAQNKI